MRRINNGEATINYFPPFPPEKLIKCDSAVPNIFFLCIDFGIYAWHLR